MNEIVSISSQRKTHDDKEEKQFIFLSIVTPIVDPKIEKIAKAIQRTGAYVSWVFNEYITPNLEQWKKERGKYMLPWYQSHCIVKNPESSKSIFSLIFLSDRILFQFPKTLGLLGEGSYKKVVVSIDVEQKEVYASAGLIPPNPREVSFLRALSNQGCCVKLFESMTYFNCGKSKHEFEGKLKQRLVLEYLPYTLHKVLYKEGYPRPTPAQKKTIFDGLVRGVATLHKMKFLHRDIKPGNVLLDEEMNPKLTDLGSMCEIGEKLYRGNHMTTCWFASYEYAEAVISKSELELIKANSYPLDAFSLGITLAELLGIDVNDCPWRMEGEKETFAILKNPETPLWPTLSEEDPENSPQAYVCQLTRRNPSARLSVIELEKKLDRIDWDFASNAQDVADEKKS